jgi:hypothetical protein
MTNGMRQCSEAADAQMEGTFEVLYRHICIMVQVVAQLSHMTPLSELKCINIDLPLA